MKRDAAFLLLGAILALAVLASAQTGTGSSLNQGIDSLFAARGFDQVAIGPDGVHVAWVEKLPDRSGNTGIFVVDRTNTSTKPQRISGAANGGSHDEGHIAWSRDGKHLAFLSDAAEEGQLQLYVSDLSSAAPRKLTSLKGFLDEPQWSPDGKTIAILFTENAPRAAGPLMPMTPETGVIGKQIFEQRLTAVDAGSGETKQLSPADMYVHEYDWSPDSKSFVVTAAPGEGDSNWYVVQLYVLSASGQMKSIHKPAQQIAKPRWSPDGKSVAFIAGIMSDEGSTGGDIFLVPASGGEARNLTPNIAASPNSLIWTSADHLLFSEIIDGQLGVATIDLSSRKINNLWSGPEVISVGGFGEYGVSLAADQKTAAVIRQSFSNPPEIWAGPIGQWTQITHVNDEVKPVWGEAKNIHWKSDPFQVEGWLLYPRNYDSKQRYPMVVCVHGGPAVGEVPFWPGPFFNTSLLSARGYFVLYPNPRGSYGQGEAFTRANVKDFGYGDLRDILAGVDQVVKDLPVDNDRVGITGWSYGGFMTMWAVTQTHRFRAAVSGAGLSNWQSYYGENDIDEWMIPYFGATVYDDPEVYAKSSAMNFIKNATTPTLVLVGDRDGEVPAPQSREFWHALKTRGVETQLVIYQNEGHFIGQPEHQRDIIQRTIGWFDDHMKAK